jgi:hypothetical protein
VEGRRPRSRDGTLLCPAQLPGALDPVAANDLIGINSNMLQNRFVMPITTKCRGLADEVSEKGSAKPCSKPIDFTSLTLYQYIGREGAPFWTTLAVAPNYTYPEKTPSRKRSSYQGDIITAIVAGQPSRPKRLPSPGPLASEYAEMKGPLRKRHLSLQAWHCLCLKRSERRTTTTPISRLASASVPGHSIAVLEDSVGEGAVERAI